MTTTGPVNGAMACDRADELAAAYALGAMEADERTAVEAHLATCPRAHAELRELLGVEEVLAASLEPVGPSPGLRDRVMASIGATPQLGAAAAPERAAARPRGGWLEWLSPRVARGIAAAAVVVAVVAAGWNVYLLGEVSNRDATLRSVAAAISGGQAAFRVSGAAGTGYVVETGTGSASLVVADVQPLQTGRIYELWLIGADNQPVAVGTFGGASQPVAVVPLERGLSGFQTFAVTVESHRVDAPTSQPVMVAKLGG